MKYYSGIPRRAGIVTVLIYLAVFLPAARALICYRCTLTPPKYGEPNIQCSKFDYSSRFYQDCPTSTFCMKRMIQYRLPNGTMMSIAAERDCASQKYVFQEFDYGDREWHFKQSVDTDAYADGCIRGTNRNNPNGPSEYCYCSSNYCNESSGMTSSLRVCSFLVITVLLYFKFL